MAFICHEKNIHMTNEIEFNFQGRKFFGSWEGYAGYALPVISEERKGFFFSEKVKISVDGAVPHCIRNEPPKMGHEGRLAWYKDAAMCVILYEEGEAIPNTHHWYYKPGDIRRLVGKFNAKLRLVS